MRLLSYLLLLGGIVALLLEFPKTGMAMVLAGWIWWSRLSEPKS